MFLARIFVLTIIWAVALLPTEIFLVMRYLLKAEGFWQNLALFGAGIYLLGGMQLVFFIGGFLLSLSLWLATSND